MQPHESTDILFWDVDTQYDFMTPPEEGGKLYVRDGSDPDDPGAAAIVPVLEALSRFAREHNVMRVATGDWHYPGHREIDAENPDFRTTFPPHCMAGELGSRKIPETALRDPLVIHLRSDDGHAYDVARRAVREHRDIFVEKEEFSCFTGNPATEALIRALDPSVVVVYGVALDVCVKAAVEGMVERGRRVMVVADATAGLGLEPAEELLADWRRRGVEVVESGAVGERLGIRE
jgi:nicotinamidase/pyrazinamidase